MLSSRLFWKIFATYAVVTGLAGVAFVTILSLRQEEVARAQVLRQLHDSAVILQDLFGNDLETGPRSGMQDQLKAIAKRTGTRVTLIAEDGSIVGDSHESPLVMENHRNRPELLAARKHGSGLDERVSATIDEGMMYYALRHGPAKRPLGFVRVAMPLESINQQVAKLRWTILATVGGISLVILSSLFFFARRIIRPLRDLTEAAQSISEGRYDTQVEVADQDELGILAGSFNHMSRELSRRIDQLERKGRELEQNSEQLQTILGSMVEGVIAFDRNERILFANQTARELLDIPAAVEHRPIWEVLRNPSIQTVVRTALEGEALQQVEVEIPRTQSVVSIVVTRLSGEPCPGAVLVLHDVTELRRLEKIRRDFVANVSHELKTPLTSIQAYADTLLAGAVDDHEHRDQFLSRISEQADRLHALILDLLRLARIESGEDVYEVRRVSLAETVQSCLQERAALAESHHIALKTEPSEEDLSVMADEEGLRTILDNLVDNAINYTPAGGSVTIRWRRENSTVVLEVEDTGVGISQDHQSRIFERFYRVDKARSRELGGTGLGLSIVKHLTQRFGGNVELTSQLGKGSTFSIGLPCA